MYASSISVTPTGAVAAPFSGFLPTLSAGQLPASAGAATASDNRPARSADWAARARLRFDVDMIFSP
jgi:hypothetical protein